MEIACDAYLNKLPAKRGNWLVKIVTGIRCSRKILSAFAVVQKKAPQL